MESPNARTTRPFTQTVSSAVIARALFLALCLSPALVWAGTEDFFLKIPSYLALQVGGSNQQSRNASLQAGLNIKKNWMLGLGVDGGNSPSMEEDKTLRSQGAQISLSSDPLETFSAQGTVETWGIEEQVQATGGKLAASISLSKFLFSVQVGTQQIVFKELPKLLWSDGTSVVTDNWLGVAADYFATARLSLRASMTLHNYDKEMTDYAQGVRVRFVAPSVLTTASSLNKNEILLGAAYQIKRWSMGFTVGRAQAALDEIKTRSFGVSGGYKLNRRWAFNAALTAFKPEDAEEDDGANITSILGAAYSW